MGVIESGDHKMIVLRHCFVVGNKLLLHPGSKLKLFPESLLPETFIEKPDILYCNNNYARDGLYKGEVLDYRAHSLAFFFNIAYQNKSKWCIIVINRDYDIYALNSQVFIPESSFSEFQKL